MKLYSFPTIDFWVFSLSLRWWSLKIGQRIIFLCIIKKNHSSSVDFKCFYFYNIFKNEFFFVYIYLWTFVNYYSYDTVYGHFISLCLSFFNNNANLVTNNIFYAMQSMNITLKFYFLGPAINKFMYIFRNRINILICSF